MIASQKEIREFKEKLEGLQYPCYLIVYGREKTDLDFDYLSYHSVFRSSEVFSSSDAFELVEGTQFSQYDGPLGELRIISISIHVNLMDGDIGLREMEL